jgi:hypothetical protein
MFHFAKNMAGTYHKFQCTRRLCATPPTGKQTRTKGRDLVGQAGLTDIRGFSRQPKAAKLMHRDDVFYFSKRKPHK